MSQTDQLQEAEKQQIREAREKGGLTKAVTYVRFSGPGWLQGAITLGGGSLAGSLYLGVLGGYSLMWLQPLAMIMGVIMLSAISYVTLSTNRRPLQTINDYINPVLGWGWAIATLMANIVWCLPQFALGTAAVQQNLLPVDMMPALQGNTGKMIICAVLLAAAITVIWFYDSGSKGIKIFEMILKTMVAFVVLCFFGVVIKMSFTDGGLPWGEIFSGLLIPNFSLLTEPSASFSDMLAATGAFSDYWKDVIVTQQRDVMITAAATAVGINMTFLLPYSMLKKKWNTEFRGLAIFDLATGLFIPFMLATACVVIASAARFHTTPQKGILENTAPEGMMAQFAGNLTGRLQAELGADAVAALSEDELKALLAAMPEGDKRMAAALVKRDAFNLAESLEELTGKTVAQYVFGLGVLGMALSTIIILMLISGFTICEMLRIPPTGWPHRIGCLIAGIGVLGPFVWSGKTQFWLAVPTSVFGMMLLPIAYLSFFLLMNNKTVLGEHLPKGNKKLLWNGLMLVALAASAFGAIWSIWSRTNTIPGTDIQVRWVGITLAALFILLAVVIHFVRPPKRN